MTWLTIKTSLKKMYAFFKIYWYVPLLLSWAAIAWFLLRRSSADILNVLHTAEKNYREQIAVLNKSYKEEAQKRDQALKRYEDTIRQLEREKKHKNKELSAKEKKRVKELAEKHKDDPEAYAREIAHKFGFKYVEVK